MVKSHKFKGKDMSKTKLKVMDLCFSNVGTKVELGIVLTDPIKVPYFNDGVASQHANVPLDIQNPEEWKNLFDAHIVYDLVSQEYKVCSVNFLEKFELDNETGYIPFDMGTSRLRPILGLIELGRSTWKKTR